MKKVTVRQEKLTIPTYETAEYDKNPMFLEKRVYQGSSGRVYPHPVCEGVADVKTDREYDAVFLENDYILVMILPELGGRIQRLYDKTNGYDAVYYNEVIKPALVGLAGPWISGGIEFNWPQHHRPTTFLPVGADIGEGTVNFPVFQNGKFNADASVTLDKGYGSILTRALDRLQDAGFAFDSRKELADYVQTKPSAIKKAAYDRVTAVIQEETVAFVNDIKMQFVKVMSRVGAFVEVAYVYGGGASPVQSLLHRELIDVSKGFSNEFPILYLDSAYSRFLNREGLMWIANEVAKADAQKA